LNITSAAVSRNESTTLSIDFSTASFYVLQHLTYFPGLEFVEAGGCR